MEALSAYPPISISLGFEEKSIPSDIFCISFNSSSNNVTGGGYGIRIPENYRDQYFNKNWESVDIEFDDRPPITINVSELFRRKYIELRSSAISI